MGRSGTGGNALSLYRIGRKGESVYLSVRIFKKFVKSEVCNLKTRAF